MFTADTAARGRSCTSALGAHACQATDRLEAVTLLEQNLAIPAGVLGDDHQNTTSDLILVTDQVKVRTWAGPLVVLANLSGFDGSPESMRKLQLEYGAEIGRAIVNFDGPIVFCVISRYHGDAFVVFSKALNPNMTVLAVDGSFASVLGGAPAAAVVFSGDVNTHTANDQRVRALEARVATASGTDRATLNAKLDELRTSVRAEKLGEWPLSSTGCTTSSVRSRSVRWTP